MGKTPKGVSIKYTNTEIVLEPSYVEGAHGGVTPEGALHVSFFSDYMEPSGKIRMEAAPDSTENSLTVNVNQAENSQIDEEGYLAVTRKIEASLLINEKALEKLIGWLQTKLQEMKSG